MAHTPGPWYANDECIESAGPEGPRDVTLAVVTHSADAHADARLIAAAPALLAALREIISCAHINMPYGGKAYCVSDGRMDAARAVIANAEGQGG